MKKNSQKVLLSTLSAAVVLIGVGSAFAHDSGAPSTKALSSIAVVSSPTPSATPKELKGIVNWTPEQKAQITALNNQIETLRQQISAVDVQIKTAREANAAALKAWHTDKPDKTFKDEAKKNKADDMQFKKQLDDLKQQYKHLDKSDKKGKAQFKEKIKALEEEWKLTVEKRKGNSEAELKAKAAWKAEQVKLQGLREQMKQLEAKGKVLHDELKKLEDAREAGLKTYHAAVKKGNFTDSVTGLNAVLTAEKQMLAKKQEILKIQLDIKTAINAFIAANPKVSQSTPSA